MASSRLKEDKSPNLDEIVWFAYLKRGDTSHYKALVGKTQGLNCKKIGLEII